MFSDALYANNPNFQKGLGTVKKAFSSNSAMALIILYGITLLISLITFFMTVSDLSSFLYNINTILKQFDMEFTSRTSSYYYGNLAQQIQSVFVIVGIVILAIQALPFVGMLVSYIKSKSQNGSPSGGITVLAVSGIIGIVSCAAVLLLFVVVFFTSLAALNSASQYFGSSTTSAVGAVTAFVYMIFIAIFIVPLLFSIGMCLASFSAKKSIRDNVLYIKGWKLMRVASIIMACMIGLSALISIGIIAESFVAWLIEALNTAIYIVWAVFNSNYLKNVFLSNNGGFVPPVNNTNTYYNSVNPAYPQQNTNPNYYARPNNQNVNPSYYPQQSANSNYYAQPRPQQSGNPNYYTQPQKPTNSNYYVQPSQQSEKANYYNPQPVSQPNATAVKSDPKPVNLQKSVDDVPIAVSAVSSTAPTEKPAEPQNTVCPACNTSISGKALFCPNCGHKF